MWVFQLWAGPDQELTPLSSTATILWTSSLQTVRAREYILQALQTIGSLLQLLNSSFIVKAAIDAFKLFSVAVFQ